MTRPPEPSDDAFLQAALRAMPPDVDPEALEALKHRVRADWSGAVAAQATRPVDSLAGVAVGAGSSVDARRGFGARPGAGRRRWMAAAALVLALIAAYAWTQRPDPSVEELMRLDVLSQMAAGQM